MDVAVNLRPTMRNVAKGATPRRAILMVGGEDVSSSGCCDVVEVVGLWLKVASQVSALVEDIFARPMSFAGRGTPGSCCLIA